MSAKFKTSGITITERGPAASAKVVDVNVPKAVGDTPILLTRGRRRGPVAMATTPVPSRTRADALVGRAALRSRESGVKVFDHGLIHPLLPDRDDYAVDLSIVFGSHKRLQLLQRCVRSIRRACARTSYEIVVGVGDTDDESGRWLAEQADCIVVDGGTDGAVAAFNAAWQRSRGRFVMALNDDAELFEDTVERALKYFEDPMVGQVAMSFLEKGRWKIEKALDRIYANFAVTRANILRAVTGICGGMWATCYSTYGGDNELSCWVYRLGYRIAEAKDARVRHDEVQDDLRKANLRRDKQRGQFFKRWPSADRLAFRGPLPSVTPNEIATLRSLEVGETPRQRWHRLESVDPALGELPPRTRPSPERVLQLHLWTADDPQRSMAQAFERLGTAGHHRIDWTKIPDTASRDRALVEAARDLQPTLVFLQLQADRVITTEAIRAIRQGVHDPSLVVCVWSGDVGPTNGPWAGLSDQWSYLVAREVDVMLFTGTGQVQLHRSRGMQNAAYLQIGYDEDRYKPGSDEQWGRRHDVVWMGQDYNRQYDVLPDSEAQLRRDAVMALKSIPRAGIYGSGWGTQGMPQIQAGDAYRESKMALSISLTSRLARYTSDRLIRAMACGCTPLVRRFDDMAGLGLVEGENCIGWTTVPDMLEQIRHWRARPDEIRAMGKAAAELARTRHTWTARMEELAAIVAALRSGR